MSSYIKTFFILLLLTPFLTGKASASIKDPPEKVLQIVDKVQEQLSIVDKGYSEIEEATRQGMAGIMGTDAVKLFKTVSSSVKEVREFQPASVISYMGPLLADPDTSDMIDKLDENYVYKTGEGDDSAKAKKDQLQHSLIQRDNIASLYSKALVTRFLLQKEKENSAKAPDISQKDTIEVVHSDRAISNQIALRLIDILGMEAANLEYEATRDLRSLPVKHTDD